jgi:hypothetical protein
MISSVSVPGSYLVGSHDLAIGGGDGEPRRVLVCVVTVTSAVSYPADQPHSLARAVNVADPSWIGSERSLSQVTVLQTIGAHKPTGHLTSIIAASRAHQWVIDPCISHAFASAASSSRTTGTAGALAAVPGSGGCCGRRRPVSVRGYCCTSLLYVAGPTTCLQSAISTCGDGPELR